MEASSAVDDRIEQLLAGMGSGFASSAMDDEALNGTLVYGVRAASTNDTSSPARRAHVSGSPAAAATLMPAGEAAAGTTSMSPSNGNVGGGAGRAKKSVTFGDGATTPRDVVTPKEVGARGSSDSRERAAVAGDDEGEPPVPSGHADSPTTSDSADDSASESDFDAEAAGAAGGQLAAMDGNDMAEQFLRKMEERFATLAVDPADSPAAGASLAAARRAKKNANITPAEAHALREIFSERHFTLEEVAFMYKAFVRSVRQEWAQRCRAAVDLEVYQGVTDEGQERTQRLARLARELRRVEPMSLFLSTRGVLDVVPLWGFEISDPNAPGEAPPADVEASLVPPIITVDAGATSATATGGAPTATSPGEGGLELTPMQIPQRGNLAMSDAGLSVDSRDGSASVSLHSRQQRVDLAAAVSAVGKSTTRTRGRSTALRDAGSPASGAPFGAGSALMQGDVDLNAVAARTLLDTQTRKSAARRGNVSYMELLAHIDAGGPVAVAANFTAPSAADPASGHADPSPAGVETTRTPTAMSFAGLMEWIATNRALAKQDKYCKLKIRMAAQGAEIIPSAQIDGLFQVFSNYDSDGSGAIDAHELGQMFVDLTGGATGKDGEVAATIDPEDLEQLMLEVDRDGSGTIDFEECLLLLGGATSHRPPDTTADGSSDADDADASLNATDRERKSAEARRDLATSVAQILRAAFLEADPHRTGWISLNQLRTLISEVCGGLRLSDGSDGFYDSGKQRFLTAEDVEAVIDVAHVRGDGYVHYESWDALWSSARALSSIQRH